MRYPHAIARWLSILFLAFIASPAQAEILFGQKTLGYEISESDVVVRAVITGIAPAADPSRADNSVWIRFQLDVRETLMGPPASAITFYLQGPHVPLWAFDRSEQLFFLESCRQGRKRQSPESKPTTVANWLELHDNPYALTADLFRGPVISDDLQVLTTASAVLEVARRVGPMARATDRSTLSRCPTKSGLDWPSVFFWLYVGLADGTFTAARKWIEAADPEMRWCGAEVLVHAKTPENIAALRRFASSTPYTNRYGPPARAGYYTFCTAGGRTICRHYCTRRPYLISIKVRRGPPCWPGYYRRRFTSC